MPGRSRPPSYETFKDKLLSPAWKVKWIKVGRIP